ncbi:MAG: TetR family transcriptional regulator [Myxococcales bacterium]|nr:TetR family transcriptional regulator [Myxococcales bacterium]
MAAEDHTLAASFRDDLIERAMALVQKQGLGDTSLRSIATQLGTSHRMLIYHFGSTAEFWDAVTTRVHERDRRALAETAGHGVVPWIEDTWADLASPENLSFARLMFEVYGQALGDSERFDRFLSQVVDGWVDSLVDALHRQFRLTRREARGQARLWLAVLRGLLLDLLTTGDRAATTEALELFASSMRLARRKPRPPLVGLRMGVSMTSQRDRVGDQVFTLVAELL